jgi:ligand-binding sensor domain-containing protein
MNPYKKIVLLLLLVLIKETTAQPELIKPGQIELEHGLSQSSVSSIVQDSYGFMWFGTQDGLNRYDGYTVKVFKLDSDDINSISENLEINIINKN